ncbi:hypothetical protein DM860_000939 [Cuscuta australis]|uniref:Uncharacterized protein n=1 Tax=Cuscuta australis TaxID=267555 RepID=A0A328DW66_9ASTE|nr:hypothetical protein DM860_000939 [Cuscuta australis]
MELELVTTAELTLKLGSLNAAAATHVPQEAATFEFIGFLGRQVVSDDHEARTSADFRHSLDALRVVSSSRFQCNEQDLSPDHLLCVMKTQCKVDQTALLWWCRGGCR